MDVSRKIFPKIFLSFLIWNLILALFAVLPPLVLIVIVDSIFRIEILSLKLCPKDGQLMVIKCQNWYFGTARPGRTIFP